MEVKLKSICPQCHAALKVGDSQIGKSVRCPACGHRFELSSVRVATQASLETAHDAESQLEERSTAASKIGKATAEKRGDAEPTLETLVLCQN